jgi:hypothetical protein
MSFLTAREAIIYSFSITDSPLAKAIPSNMNLLFRYEIAFLFKVLVNLAIFAFKAAIFASFVNS